MIKSRRTFSAEFKAKVAIEAIKEIRTISELAQLYQVHPKLISSWKKEFLSNAGKVFDSGKDETEQIKKLQKEIKLTYVPFLVFILIQHGLMYYSDEWTWWKALIDNFANYST